MPPKTKNKKSKGKKSCAVVDGAVTEMSMDELWEQAVQLQEELDRVRKEKNYFQLERDKTLASWEVSKRNLQEAEYELRNRRREVEEGHQRSQREITKLKHVLAEENNAVSERKIDSVSSTSLIQDQHTESELVLHGVAQGWQSDCEQKKLHKQSCIKELLLKNQLELIEMNKDYERRLQEMDVKYHQKMQSLIEAKEKERRMAVRETDEHMKSHVASLITDHDRVLEKAKKDYFKHETEQKKEMKLLKNGLEELETQEARVSKRLSVAKGENKCLREILHEAQQKLTELKKQLQDPHLTRDAIVRHQARVKVLDKQILEMTVKHEQMQQAVERVQRERDELVTRQTQRMLNIQQKSGLKKMLLEKKLAALTETLEKTEVQLYAAISVSSQDLTTRSTAAKKLEEIMNSKQAIANTMEEHLARDCKEYDNLRHSCMKRLRDKGITLHDFHFKSTKQVLKEVTPNI